MDLPDHIRKAFSDEELRQNKEMFDSFDEDGGGTIDAKEFSMLASTLGLSLTADGAQELIDEIDLDGDGLVDFTEFLTLMMDLRQGGLDRNKKAKSSKLTKVMKLAVKRAEQVRARKQQQIDEAQHKRKLQVMEAERIRVAQVEALEKKKKDEQEKIIRAGSRKTAIQEKRLRQINEKAEIEIQRKDQAIRQKFEEGQMRAAQEKEAVFRQAAIKAERTNEALRDAVERKTKALLDDEKQRVQAEISRQHMRAVNARRAEIERHFTRTQLEALREQFEAADTDNSGAIDAEELYAVCKKMGENISLKQCKAIISEVDDDDSGKIEWEEYLIVMGKRKGDAARRGSGLFQKMAMKAEEAARRKDEQILKKQAEREAALAISEEERTAAVIRAQRAKEIEQQQILMRNLAAEEAAQERAMKVEIEKSIVLQQRAQEIGRKSQLGEVSVILKNVSYSKLASFVKLTI